MADSPLSIVASVTGILTFVAAILASIVVRVKIVQDGNREMESTLQSVQETLSTLAVAIPRGVEQDATTDLFVSVKELAFILHEIVDTFEKELGVTFKIAWPDLGPDASRENQVESDLHVQDIPEQWREAKEPGYPEFSFSLPGWSRLEFVALIIGIIIGAITYLFALIQTVVLRLGATSKGFKWYLIRDEVLEKLRKSEGARSRLLFYQVSLAARRTQSLESSIAKLTDDVAQLNSTMQEVRRTLNNEDRISEHA